MFMQGCLLQIYANQCARVQIVQGKMPNMNTITYIFINSGIQTFRKPYAALSRPYATAAKHTYTRILKALHGF
jgi:hypothetical protein